MIEFKQVHPGLIRAYVNGRRLSKDELHALIEALNEPKVTEGLEKKVDAILVSRGED